MRETICTETVLPDKNEGELEIQKDEEVISIYLQGELICELDWDNNFKQLIYRLMKVWD